MVTSEIGRIVAVDLHGTLADDYDLDYLRYLPWVKRLDLSETAVTDLAAAKILSLTKLEWVSFRQTRVTHKGVETVAEVMPWVTIVGADGATRDGQRPSARRADGSPRNALKEILACGRRTMVRGERDDLHIVKVSFPDSKIRDEEPNCLQT